MWARSKTSTYGAWAALTVAALFWSGQVAPHGNVALIDDQCYLELGFVDAHFTIFQPELSGHTEYCEDLPHPGETVFVLEYANSGPYLLPMDFRIIRDEPKLGPDASWEDIQKIQDLDALTVFYSPPRVHPFEVFSTRFAFTQSGDYVGIMSAREPRTGNQAHAVFAFEVGPEAEGLPVLALVLLVVLLLTVGVWFLNRKKT